MNDIEALTNRVTELESQLSFQQATLDSLNDTVVEQWALIDVLKKRLKTMDDQLYSLQEAQGPDPANQKPPHY